MKKIIVWIAVAALLLAGCAKDTSDPLDGIRVTVLSVEELAEETVLEVKWENATDYFVLYGEAFGLQKWENGQWQDCPMKENTGFHSIGYGLEAEKNVTVFYKLRWAFGDLEPGKYRFITTCMVTVNANEVEQSLSAEFTLSGNGETVPPLKSEFSEPPRLTIGSLADAVTGGYSWSYAVGNGSWCHVIADSTHPLQMKEHLQVISPGNATVDLNFEDWPESYTVRCWPDSEFGNPDAKSEAVMTWNYSIQLKNGGYIYEVTAVWEEDDSAHNGTVTYVFYAAPAIAHDVMPISMGTDLYIAGEILRLDPARAETVNDILTSLDYKESMICKCLPEYKLQLPNGMTYGIHLGEGYARCDQGQANLTKQQVAELSAIIQWALVVTKAK